MNQNPYAPPRAEAVVDFAQGALTSASGGLRREGDLIVIPVTGASFPERCVICNEAAARRLKRRVFWHPPGYYALIFTGWALYLIVSLIVRKRAEFEVGLCERHVKRRRNAMLFGWLGSIALVVAAVAIGDKNPALAGLCVLCVFACFIASMLMVRVVTAKRIDKQWAWLKFERPFLDSIEYGPPAP